MGDRHETSEMNQVREQPQRAQHADLPFPMQPEAGGEGVVGFDDAAGEDAKMLKPAVESRPARGFDLDEERMHRAPVERFTGLGQEPLPKAVGEVFETRGPAFEVWGRRARR